MRLPTLAESKTLRYGVFFYLYVMQGVPAGFALTAITNYLTSEGVRSAAVGTFVAVVGLPWTVQFVWGPVIDLHQSSPLGRRRPWVLLSMSLAFLASLGMLLVKDPRLQLTALSLAFFVHSVFDSIQDASVDALAISVTPDGERGRVNAFMRGGFLFGTGVGAAGLSYVIRHFGFSSAALLHSALLLLMTVVMFFVREKSGDALLPCRGTKTRRSVEIGRRELTPRVLFAELFRGFFAAASLRIFGAIILVYLCLSIFIRAFSVHVIRELHWADTTLSILTGTYGIAVAMLVTLVAGVISDRVGVRRLLLITMTVIGGFLLIFNALAPWWAEGRVAATGLVLWYTFDPSFSVAAMPVLMSLCRQGVEGSQFTTYMALVNLSDVVGAYVSGHALTWFPAPLVGLACGAAIITAMLMAGWSLRRERLPKT